MSSRSSSPSQVFRIFFLFLLLPLGVPEGAAQEARAPFVLWYDRPAQAWVEALPVGSGRARSWA